MDILLPFFAGVLFAIFIMSLLYTSKSADLEQENIFLKQENERLKKVIERTKGYAKIQKNISKK